MTGKMAMSRVALRITCLEALGRDLVALEVVLGDRVVVVGEHVQQVVVGLVGGILHVGGDLLDVPLLAELVVVDDRLPSSPGRRCRGSRPRSRSAAGSARPRRRPRSCRRRPGARASCAPTSRSRRPCGPSCSRRRSAGRGTCRPGARRSRTAARRRRPSRSSAIEPSSTRSERSTSTVKSTWPGVSMMLIRWSSQNAVVAAEVMVMPRSCSCSIQSMVAAPSWTSPSLWVRPGVEEDALGRRRLARIDVGHDSDVARLL